MPVSLTYPGVYVEEIPSGVRTITGVATSITAFVGRTARGPVNEPVTINSFGDFERTFGGLWAGSSLGFAVRDFFLNGGGQAVIVRLFHPYYDTESEQAAALAAAQAVADTARIAVKFVEQARAKAISEAISSVAALFSDDPNKTAVNLVAKAAADTLKEGVLPGDVANAAKSAADQQPKDTKAAAQAVAQIAALILQPFQADKEGGRLQAVVSVLGAMAGLYTESPEQEQAVKILASAQSAADLGGATPQTVATAALDAVPEASKAKPAADAAQIAADTFEKLDLAVEQLSIRSEAHVQAMKAPSNSEKQAAQEVARAIKKCAQPGTPVDTVLTALDSMVSAAAAPSRAQLEAGSLVLEAANSGAWGDLLLARVDHDVDGPDLFNLAICDGSVTPARVEYFRNLSLSSRHARRVDKVLENESRLVRLLGDLPTASARPDASPEPQPGKNLWDRDLALCYKVTLHGHDGQSLISDDFTGPGKEGAGAGLYALERTDLFNLLCIPLYNADDDVYLDVIPKASAYCERRRAVLLVDPPSTWTSKEAAKKGVGEIGAVRGYAALFFPRLLQPNPLHDNQMETFAPCGAVAGVIARTDAQRGVWKAPAGQEATLVGVPKLRVPLTDAENGELNPLGINCLRAMPAAGRVIWGARTLDGNDRLASPWKYLPVRRTALFIEESLYRGLQWAVFEPNDEELWSQLRLNVTSFMLTLFRRGAFQGATPSQAFFVKCDRDTNPQENIDLGIVTVQVGFAPLKPAEFVVVQISQKAGQTS